MSTSSPDDLGFSLTPGIPGVVNPDLAINAALAPVVDDPETTLQPLGRGWSFDFLNNEFVMDGLSPANVYDSDELVIWIEKTCRTASGAHAIYGDEYGMEDPYSLLGEPYTSELIDDYITQITDALTLHDRIASVTNFTFQQDPYTDQLFASFSVVLDEDDADDVTVDSIAVGTATT